MYFAYCIPITKYELFCHFISRMTEYVPRGFEGDTLTFRHFISRRGEIAALFHKNNKSIFQIVFAYR